MNEMSSFPRKRQWYCCITMILACAPLIVSSDTNVTVRVTVIEPPLCVINNNKPIEVDFGNVLTTQVNGSNYRKRVNYTFSCTGSSSNMMKLMIGGSGAVFDPDILRTNIASLGIKFEVSSGKLPLYSWISFIYPTKPDIWAVPVKEDGVTLKGGVFTSTAIMEVAYP